jgi:hypothetical protein
MSSFEKAHDCEMGVQVAGLSCMTDLGNAFVAK